MADRSGIRHGLIAASCALLGVSSVRGQELATSADTAPGSGGQIDWLLNSALAYYHENGRIQAIEPIVEASKDYGDGELIDLNATYDSLSGATPNGALTSNRTQTFTGPSGKSLSTGSHLYSANPGALPVEPHYHDQRLGLGGSWQLPWSRLTRWSVGGKFSVEHDFLSGTLDASIAHDFNEKNTTLLFGIDDEQDSIRPIGGTPLAGSNFDLFEKISPQSKNGVGALAGVTQVMSRHWLSQLNVTADRFVGYLNDPYKIVSLLDPQGNTLGYQYERRPDERASASAYWENRFGWERLSTSLALRYMQDDWHVRSETTQWRLYVWNADRTAYWEPNVRWYQQSAAYFYSPWIDAAAPTGNYVSADQRLGAFQALTYGLEYGINLAGQPDSQQSELTVRLEYYRQIMQDTTPAPPVLQGLDLYPGLQAILLQFGYAF